MVPLKTVKNLAKEEECRKWKPRQRSRHLLQIRLKEGVGVFPVGFHHMSTL
jgi:hypothetical protein